MKTQMTRGMANFLLGCGLALLMVCAAFAPGLAQMSGPPYVQKCHYLCSRQQGGAYGSQCMTECQICFDGDCSCWWAKSWWDDTEFNRCVAQHKDKCQHTGRRLVPNGAPMVFDYGTKPFGPNCGGVGAPTFVVCAGSTGPDPDHDICSNETVSKQCSNATTAVHPITGRVYTGLIYTCQTVQTYADGDTSIDRIGCRCWHNGGWQPPLEG